MSCGKKVCVIGGGTSGLAGMVQLLGENEPHAAELFGA